MKRNLFIGAAFVSAIVVLGVGSSVLGRKAEASAVQAPRFEVDPMWPKPLPNHWVMGNTIGVSVDASDHIWIIHRAGLARSQGNLRHHHSARSRLLRCPRLRCSNSIRRAT